MESMTETKSQLAGTWKLLSFDIEAQDSGERQPFYGQAGADGFLILMPEGRMMALITSGGREPGQTEQQQAALFRTMLSYTGTYRVEDDKFITKVDLSWNEAWNGTDQVRHFNLDGNQLDIVSAWAPSPIYPDRLVSRAILSWTREK